MEARLGHTPRILQFEEDSTVLQPMIGEESYLFAPDRGHSTPTVLPNRVLGQFGGSSVLIVDLPLGLMRSLKFVNFDPARWQDSPEGFPCRELPAN